MDNYKTIGKVAEGKQESIPSSFLAAQAAISARLSLYWVVSDSNCAFIWSKEVILRGEGEEKMKLSDQNENTAELDLKARVFKINKSQL